MPKKPKEIEEQIDISQQKKEPPATVTWFKNHAVENPSDLKIVCDLVARSVEDQFKIHFANREYSQGYGTIFYNAFMAILRFLRKQQKVYKQFTILIFNSLNIGYTNSDDEDAEKVGNFMPVMEYAGINRVMVSRPKYSLENAKNMSKAEISRLTAANLEAALDEWYELNTTSDPLTRWQCTNTKKNGEFYNQISTDATNALKQKSEGQLSLRADRFALTIMAIFMDMLVSVMRMKFQEAEGTGVSEVKMNVFGLFDVFYSFNEEENQEIIEYQPNITMKLALKQDSVASND